MKVMKSATPNHRCYWISTRIRNSNSSSNGCSFKRPTSTVYSTRQVICLYIYLEIKSKWYIIITVNNVSELTEEELAIRRQNLRKRWQDAAAFDQRTLHQDDQVLLIRVPEPGIVGSQSGGIKPREPSQTEKGSCV